MSSSRSLKPTKRIRPNMSRSMAKFLRRKTERVRLSRFLNPKNKKVPRRKRKRKKKMRRRRKRKKRRQQLMTKTGQNQREDLKNQINDQTLSFHSKVLQSI